MTTFSFSHLGQIRVSLYFWNWRQEKKEKSPKNHFAKRTVNILPAQGINFGKSFLESELYIYGPDMLEFNVWKWLKDFVLS